MNDCDELDLEDLFSGRIDKRELEVNQYFFQFS